MADKKHDLPAAVRTLLTELGESTLEARGPGIQALMRLGNLSDHLYFRIDS